MQQATNQHQHNPVEIAETAATHILSNEKTQAIQQLIKLTDNLANLAERESQAIAQNDMVSFTILQDEKALIAEHYAAAAQEFRNRLPEFRGMNPALLDRLETLQIRLGEATRQNNKAIKRIHDNAQKRTQTTLIDAQEIGQQDNRKSEVKNA